MIYFNQAGTSWPKPPPVRAAVAEVLDAGPEDWPERFARDHEAIAGAFGIDDPARLLLTPGATSALSVALRAQPFSAGDRVLISGHEHLALERPVRALAKLGVEIRVLPRGREEAVDLDVLEDELRRGGVKLVAMTAACNVTGEILPFEAAVALARGRGARTLIDGSQIAGWLDLDLPALGADYFAFAGHKGPQAPWGIGGLFMRTSDVALGYCDVGSVDRAAMAGLAAGLAWLAAPGRNDRLTVAQARVERVRGCLLRHAGVTLYGASSADARMPTLAFRFARQSPADLATALAEQGVVASGGEQCAPLSHATWGTAGQGLLRLSVGPSNTDDEVERLVDALDAVLGSG